MTSIIRTTIVVMLTGIFGSLCFFLGQFANDKDAPASLEFPRQVLHADSAVVSESFAVATGRIDADVDGFYTLDFLTGELQCAVMGRRNGKFSGVFRTNVVKDIGIGQNAKYILVTGQLSLPRGANLVRAADSIAYVLDENTGNFAAYAVPWRREFATAGRNQAGELILLDIGKARNAQIRE